MFQILYTTQSLSLTKNALELKYQLSIEIKKQNVIKAFITNFNQVEQLVLYNTICTTKPYYKK